MPTAITTDGKSSLLKRGPLEPTGPSPKTLETFDRIMDFAIHEEEKAYDFYTTVARKVKHPWARKAFLKFAAEELKQKERLLKMKREGRVPAIMEKPADLKITDYVTAEVVLRGEIDTREALVIAIRAAKAAQRLYMDLAEKATDAGARVVLRALAVEEAKHKLTLETEYDDRVLA
jgi:rubrerythrin